MLHTYPDNEQHLTRKPEETRRKPRLSGIKFRHKGKLTHKTVPGEFDTKEGGGWKRQCNNGIDKKEKKTHDRVRAKKNQGKMPRKNLGVCLFMKLNRRSSRCSDLVTRGSRGGMEECITKKTKDPQG